MTEKQNRECHYYIHAASTAAAAVGAGFAQIPGSDSGPLAAIQTAMIISIGRVFGVNLTDSAAKAVLTTKLSSMVGKLVARTVTQWLVGWFPGAGNAVNATTAAAITEALGWAVAEDFDKRGY